MTCSHCGASWTLPAGRPAPQNCPFCRKPLGPAWRQVHTPQEGFAWALELMGKEGLRESSRVLGLFADAGPELEGQLQLVRIFFASGSHLALLDALGRDAAAQTLARSRSLTTLTTTYYLAEPAARYICDSFWFALTGSGTAVLNAARPAAPAPAQKAQPPHYPSLSLSECTRLALADDPAAIKELAHRYELGQGGAPQSPAEALRWWRRGAENGDPESQCALGWAYHDGLGGLPRDKNAALGWFRKAADQDCGDGFYAIGWLYEHGSLYAKNLDTALAYYRTANIKNSFWGPFAPGWVLEEKARLAREEGRNSEAADFEKKANDCYARALEHFRRRAAGPWWEATRCAAALGQLYYDGLGTPQDHLTALRYFQQAAQGGDSEAMMYLGLMHSRAEGTPQNIPLALQWLEKAAALENRDAAAWLADLYLSAPEPHRNPRRARAMATAGLESVYPTTVAYCHNLLGWLYENGFDGPADANLAFFHYQQAAQKGDSEGMFNLAYCYYQGTGTAQSTTAARQWLRKAVEAAGDDDRLRRQAQDALNRI